MSAILSVQNIEKYYGNKGNVTKAVDQISFDVSEGEYVWASWAPRAPARPPS